MFLANAVGNAVSSALWGTPNSSSTANPTETKAVAGKQGEKKDDEDELFQSPVTLAQLKAFAIASTKKMPEWAPEFAEIANKIPNATDTEKMQAVQDELEKKYGTVWASQGIDPKTGSDALLHAGDLLDAEDNDQIADDCQDALDALSAAMKDAVGTAVVGKEKLERAKSQMQAAQKQSQEAQQALTARMARMNPTQKKLFLKTVTSNGQAIIKQGTALPPAQQQAFFQELPQDKKDSFINYRLLVQMGMIKG